MTPIRRRGAPIFLAALALTAGFSSGNSFAAEVCTTQSQIAPAEKTAIVLAAQNLAAKIAADDAAGVRAETIQEYASNFSGMAALIGSTAVKVKGAALAVDQVYLLDATTLKTLGDGTNQDAQFFCSLNHSAAEATFLIPSLPPGRYAFASVVASGAKTPWRLSFLLKQASSASTAPGAPAGKIQDQAAWMMAGLYPKALTAAGHDGLWYWTQARDRVKQGQLWTAYFYYLEAQALLQPAGFVSSTHLEKLRKEASTAAPPSLSEGISVDAPLVIKGNAMAAGAIEYRFTDLSTDDSFGADKIDVVVHLQADPDASATADGAQSAGTKSKTKTEAAKNTQTEVSPRERNSGAMAALLGAYPELRSNFHGVWVFADSPGKNPFITEEPMTNIR